MIIISQNQDKAIDSKDILFLFSKQTLNAKEVNSQITDTSMYKLFAKVRDKQIDSQWGVIELFQDKNQEIVNKMLCFLAKKIFNDNSELLKVSEVQMLI